MIDLDLNLVLAPVPTKAPMTLCEAAWSGPPAALTGGGVSARAVLDVGSHQEVALEGLESELVNDKCHRPLGGAIATVQLRHELSALDPVPTLRTAGRGGDPGPFVVRVPCRCRGCTILIATGCQRVPPPTTNDLADPNTEPEVVCSAGGGR